MRLADDTWIKEWMQDCRRFRGEVLRGVFAHYCADWDELPVDETTQEWPCNCFTRRQLKEREDSPPFYPGVLR